MHTVSENQCGKYALLLQQARTEAQADAATRFSSHLDAMIRISQRRSYPAWR